MTRLFLLPLLLLAGLLTACTTTQQTTTTTTAQTIQQRVAQVCPILQAGLAGVQALAVDYPQASSAVTAVTPAVTTLCAQNGTVDTSSVQELVSTGVPALEAVVNSTQLQPSAKAAINVGLVAASSLLQSLLTVTTTLTPTTTTPAS